ncbi:MAG: biopolymer transporter ExbD [candidate division Zixibacteria bacterium]|nr:biopolymer transporter ExbD [candidate division Zixibacteria bacterium]
MKIKKKRRVSILIDMTPMVDIAFLLLIFYMATTQFKPPEKKKVELPKSHSQVSLPNKDIINVTVTAEDSIFVNYIVKEIVTIDGKDISRPVRVYDEATANNVGDYINGARVRNPRAFLVIKADKNSSFGTMEAIMSTLQEQHLPRFQIITNMETDL